MYLVTLSMGRDPLLVALALGSIISAAVTTDLMSIMLCSHLLEALRRNGAGTFRETRQVRMLRAHALVFVARTC